MLRHTINVHKEYTSTIRLTSCQFYGSPSPKLNDVCLLSPRHIKELFDSTGDLELLNLTPYDLRPLPSPQGKTNLDFLQESRVFRMGNSLLDRVTKKAQLPYAAFDSCSNYFRNYGKYHDGRPLLVIGITKLGSSIDVFVNGDITYVGANFVNKDFLDYNPTDWFVLSVHTISNEHGTGMKVDDHFSNWLGQTECIAVQSSQNYRGDVLIKPRPHNDQVICHIEPGSQAGRPFDLKKPNVLRNLSFKDLIVPVVRFNPDFFLLRDQARLAEQVAQYDFSCIPRFPFQIPPKSKGFDPELYDLLLESGYKNYQKRLPVGLRSYYARGDAKKFYIKKNIETRLAAGYTMTIGLE